MDYLDLNNHLVLVYSASNYHQILDFSDNSNQRVLDCLVSPYKINHLINFDKICSETPLNILMHSKLLAPLFKINSQ
jgi:hypothetical protein